MLGATLVVRNHFWINSFNYSLYKYIATCRKALIYAFIISISIILYIFVKKLKKDFMEKYDAYFSLAKTALKVLLSSYGYEKGQSILNNDFLCNSISDTLKDLDILVITYSLNNNLVPSWDELNINIKQ